MKNNILKQPILYLIVFALALRLIYLWQYYQLPDINILTVDNLYHFNWANSIASGNWLGQTTFFRAPLYIYSLAILFSLFGSSIFIARIFGMIIGICSIFITYKIGYVVFNKKTGLIAALIQSLMPILIYFEFELLLDPLFMLLFELAIYSTLKWYHSRSIKQLILTGILFGLASITRPTTLPIIPIIVLLIAYKEQKLSLMIKHSVILSLAAMIIILPIFLRNIIVADDPVVIASQGGINFYLGNRTGADGVSAAMPEPLGTKWQLKDIIYEANITSSRLLKPSEVSNYWTNKTIKEISSNPSDYFVLLGRKLYFLISNQEFSNNRSFTSPIFTDTILAFLPVKCGLLFPFVILAFLYGLHRSPKSRLLLYTIIIYALLTSLFFISSRFRLPILPFLAILSSYSLITICSDYLNNKKRFVIMVTVFSVGIMFTNFPFITSPKVYSPQNINAQAKFHYDQKNYQRALALYQQAWKVNNSSPEANLNLGSTFLKLGISDSAKYYFEQEMYNFPKRTNAFINLSSIEYLKNNFHDAYQYASQAIERKPYDPLAIRLALRSYIQLFDNKQIDENNISLCKKWAENSAYDFAVIKEIASFLYSKQRINETEILLLEAIKFGLPPIEMDDAAFQRNFTNVQKQRSKDKSIILLILGRIKGEKGELTQAVDYCKQAINADATNRIAYTEYYNVLNASRKYTQADSIYNIMIQKFSSDSLIN